MFIYFEDEEVKNLYVHKLLVESNVPSVTKEICFVRKQPPVDVKRTIDSVYRGSRYEIVPLGLILKNAMKYNIPLAKELLENCVKVEKVMYIIVPEENEVTRNIGGFSDGEITVVAVRKVGIRSIFKDAESFVNSLTPNAYIYILGIIIHELNHHVCGYSDYIFKKYNHVFEKFLTDVIDKAYYDSREIRRLYYQLTSKSERTLFNSSVKNKLVAEYVKHASSPNSKDKQLSSDISSVVNALVTGSLRTVAILQSARAVQDSVYQFYNSLLKVDSRLRGITFGQEFIVPSEITSVISQFATFNVPLSKQVAKDVLKLLT